MGKADPKGPTSPQSGLKASGSPCPLNRRSQYHGDMARVGLTQEILWLLGSKEPKREFKKNLCALA